jgi:hypothetical protein
MVIRIFLFLIILTTPVFSECFNTIQSSDKLIKNIEIDINKDRKFFETISKLYLSTPSRPVIYSTPTKKRYKAKLRINFIEGGYCTYKSSIRAHGDGSDHIEMINGYPISSLRVSLKKGNIKGITRFKLMRPKTREYANEIFATTLFNSVGFLSPRTFIINVKIGDVYTDFIFQESFKKEFLEFNNKVEGPVIESKEDLSKKYLGMAKLINKEWNKNNINKYTVSLNAVKDYNLNLLTSYPFRVGKKEDEMIRFNNDNLNSDETLKINKFDALMFAIGAGHGLSYDDRRFYYDPIYSTLEPIYYDGMSTILSTINYDEDINDYDELTFPNYKKIPPLFLNYQSNNNRTFSTRYLNPVVTRSAKNGALKLKEDLKKLNKKQFLNDLHNNGYKNITEKQLDIVMKNIFSRINEIKNAKVYEKTFNLHKSLYDKYKNEMELEENVRLYFLDNKTEIIEKKDGKIFLNIEECDIKVILCKAIKLDEKKFLKILEQRNISKNHTIFIGAVKEKYLEGKISRSKKTINNEFKNLSLSDSINILFNDDVDIIVNKVNKDLVLNYKNNSGRVIIYKSEINSWSIKMINAMDANTEEFNNIFNLTGCLTIIDSKIDNLNLTASNFNCEDTINFIRSTGNANTIKIADSKSDALDADFSNLYIKNLLINNSFNDCADFSFGEYQIQKAYLISCGDKAISVGEKSNFKINDLNINDANVGVASKDSSIALVNKAEMNNLQYCLSSYKKKQEFNFSNLIVNNLRCENFSKKIDKDKYSTLNIKNEF